MADILIAACTAVQAGLKANSQSNRNDQISTRSSRETPEKIWMKLAINNYVVGVQIQVELWQCGGLGEHVTCPVLYYISPKS